MQVFVLRAKRFANTYILCKTFLQNVLHIHLIRAKRFTSIDISRILFCKYLLIVQNVLDILTIRARRFANTYN